MDCPPFPSWVGSPSGEAGFWRKFRREMPIEEIVTGFQTRILSRAPAPLKRDLIEARVAQCRSLPSLTRNAQDIIRLLNAGQTYTHQICDIVQRDPSLTARVLRMVNSVYFGLAEPVTSIEQAVFFVGTEQIRHLAMATPVIEDFQKLAGNTPFPWRPFWQHCIAVALMTREILTSLVGPNDQSDYVAGLVHDVGKIVMAAAFPKHFLAQSAISRSACTTPRVRSRRATPSVVRLWPASACVSRPRSSVVDCSLTPARATTPSFTGTAIS